MSLLNQAINLVAGKPGLAGPGFFITNLTADFVNRVPRLTGVAFTSAGDIVVSGTYDPYNDLTKYAGLIASFDFSTGESKWQQNYGGNDEFKRVHLSDIVVSGGKVFTTGQSYSGFQSDTRNSIVVVRHDINGNLEQSIQRNPYQFNSNNAANYNGIVADSAGSIYMIGRASVGRCVLAKYDQATLAELWTSYFTISASHGASGIGITIDESTGTVWGSGTHNAGGFATEQVPSMGRWQITNGVSIHISRIVSFGPNLVPSAGKPAFRPDLLDGILCGRGSGTERPGGSTPGLGAPDFPPSSGFICRINRLNGAPSFLRTLHTPGFDTFFGKVVVDQNNNMYICGNITDSGEGKGIIAKWDSGFNLLWQRTFVDTSGIATPIVSIAHDGVDRLAFCGYNNVDNMWVACVPDDGSLTGVYGDYTYAVGNLIHVVEPNPDGGGIAPTSFINSIDKTTTQADGPDSMANVFFDLEDGPF